MIVSKFLDVFLLLAVATSVRWRSTSLHLSTVFTSGLAPIVPDITEVRGLINNQEIGKAIDVIRMLDYSSPEVSRKLIFTISESCRKTKQFSSMVELLNSIGKDAIWSEDDLMPLINQCANERRLFILQRVLEIMISKNAVITAKGFSAIIKGFAKGKNLVMVEKLLQLMNERQVLPDTILLNSVLDALISCGDHRRAFSLFGLLMGEAKFILMPRPSTSRSDPIADIFLKANISLNTRTYNIILKGLSTKDYERSFALLEIMKRKHMPPDKITINTIISACVKNHDVRRAVELLDQVEADSVGMEGYHSVLHGLTQTENNIDQAFSVLDTMMKRRIQPNRYVLASILTACVRERRFKMAKDIVFNPNATFPWIQDNDKAFLYGVFINALLDAYRGLPSSSHNQCTEDLASWQRRENKRYRFILESQKILLKMAQESLEPELSTINSILQLFCKRPDPSISAALLWMQYLTYRRLQPDGFTLATLLPALGTAGYSELAIQLYKNISDIYAVDAITTNALLQGMVNGGQPGSALALYINLTTSSQLRAQKVNVAPTTITVTNATLFSPDVITFSVLFLAVMELRSEGNARWNDNLDVPLYSSSFSPKDAFVCDEENLKLRKGIQDTLLTLRERNDSFANTLVSLGVWEADFSSVESAKRRSEQRLVYDQGECRLYESPGYGVASFADLFNRRFNGDTDKLVNHLYTEMRVTYRITVDDYMFRILNNMMDPKYQVSIGHTTARYIFEDLIAQGYLPHHMPYILETCRFSRQQVNEYMKADVINAIRQSDTSLRIFKKYGWNKVESGWSPLF